MDSDDSSASLGAAVIQRPTPRQGDYEQLPSRHTPTALALMERRRGEWWRNVSVLVCLAAMAFAYLIVRAGRATDRIHIMDPAGNMYAGPLEPMSASTRFFHITAVYATNAALQRSPVGFDLFELLKLYYTPRAIAKLQDDQKGRESDIRRRNLQWKPIIDSIGDPVAAGDNRLVEVRGRLVSAGAYANRSFYEEPAFTLVLTLSRNPDMGKAGSYPWVCHDFDLKIEAAARSSR